MIRFPDNPQNVDNPPEGRPPFWWRVHLKTFRNFLVIGPPRSGKTTFIRALAGALAELGQVGFISPENPLVGLEALRKERQARWRKIRDSKSILPEALHVFLDDFEAISHQVGPEWHLFLQKVVLDGHVTNIKLIFGLNRLDSWDYQPSHYDIFQLGPPAGEGNWARFNPLAEEWPCVFFDHTYRALQRAFVYQFGRPPLPPDKIWGPE